MTELILSTGRRVIWKMGTPGAAHAIDIHFASHGETDAPTDAERLETAQKINEALGHKEN